jgi:hypothetical protein
VSAAYRERSGRLALPGLPARWEHVAPRVRLAHEVRGEPTAIRALRALGERGVRKAKPA